SVPYVRSGDARPKAAGWTLLGAIPATIIGGLLSQLAGGSTLLVASGVVLLVIGIRVLLPIEDAARAAGTTRRQNRPLLVAVAFALGLFTGLLANGGGFLLMPLYLLVFGLRMRQAVGTSLLVIAVLSMPTLITHWALGHVDWRVAFAFMVGVVPASLTGAKLSVRFAAGAQRRSFGLFLILFGVTFTAYRLAIA
ncbi:MAG TPA: sulfite exporter TauE/SafE family protein, partial [Ilumatobacteraceae bacterium]